MKSMLVHYMNKYFGGSVEASDDKLDCYDSKGRRCMALRKNGHGAWVDVSEELGLPHRHDLSPIPKESRLYKEKNGMVVKDDQFDSRMESVEEFMVDGRVASCEELAKKGARFDHQQRLQA